MRNAECGIVGAQFIAWDSHYYALRLYLFSLCCEKRKQSYHSERSEESAALLIRY